MSRLDLREIKLVRGVALLCLFLVYLYKSTNADAVHPHLDVLAAPAPPASYAGGWGSWRQILGNGGEDAVDVGDVYDPSGGAGEGEAGAEAAGGPSFTILRHAGLEVLRNLGCIGKSQGYTRHAVDADVSAEFVRAQRD